MKFGLTLGAIVLASNVAFAQVAIDMATLERKVEDAQAAYDRNQASADRQEMSDIRDDLGYLRVKQRRGEAVTRTERHAAERSCRSLPDAHDTDAHRPRPVSTIGPNRDDRDGFDTGPRQARNPERQRSRRAPRDGADVGYGAGRGSRRSHDADRSVSRQRPARAGGIDC